MRTTSEFARWLVAARGGRSKIGVERATEGRVKRSSILRAERGERLLSYRSLRLLCAIYGVDFNIAMELMYREMKSRAFAKARKKGGEREPDDLHP